MQVRRLHPSGTFQIQNISDLIESAPIFQPNNPIIPVETSCTFPLNSSSLQEAKDHYLIWLVLSSNPLPLFEEL